MSPHLSNSNLKCQHLGKATAGAYSCPCPLMQCDPCHIPQNKAPGCPPAGAAPLTLPPGRPSGTTVSPLGMAGVHQSLPRQRVALGASAARTGIPVAVPAPSLSLTPFTSLLPFSLTVPMGAVGWSTLAALGVCVTLLQCECCCLELQPSTSISGLPEALSFLGKGRKQILPVGKS